MNIEFSEIELRKLDLNLLLVFSAVMREGSVAGAASRLYLGASAISMALGRLREALDDPLFIRTPKGMEPTARAVDLWSQIGPALAQIEQATATPQVFDPATTERLIRFGVPDDLEFALLPLLFERLNEEAPGLALSLRPGDFQSLEDRLESEDADIVLSALPEGGLRAPLEARVLWRESFSVLYDPKQIEVKGSLDLETYLSHPHILRSVSGDLSGAVDRRLAKMGKKRRVIAALSSFPTIALMCRNRPVLANVPATAATHLARQFGLEQAPLPYEPPDFDLGLVWPKRKSSDPLIAWFVDLVADCLAELRDL